MTEKSAQERIDDGHYRQALQSAREDAAGSGIHTTQEEVEAEASRLREQAARNARINALASAFHEEWRQTRFNQENGLYEPRIKTTKDTAWIEAHGTDQVDIANTDYSGLPSDWQAENKAAAEVVVGIMDKKPGINLSDPAVRSEVGGSIHDAWLSRNDWAKGGELDVPFDQLPPEEQVKDIHQIEVAQRMLS